MRRNFKRPSPAMIVALVALFVAMGGSVYAANHISGKTIKKNSEPGNRIKKKSLSGNRLKNDTVTGSKIKEATLGTVPGAASLTGFTPFAGSGTEDTIKTLFSTGQFDVVGICDENGDFDPPGFQNPNTGSVIGIINRGQNHGVADTYDDDDTDFNINEGVAFDYIDGGDPGTAVLPNGHWIHVLGGTITESSTNGNFGTGCTFHGLVFYG